MVSRTAHVHFQKFCNSKVRVVKKIILLKDKMMHQLGCIKTLLQESEACDLSTGTGIQQLIASPGITCSFFQHGLPFPVRSCDPKQHHPSTWQIQSARPDALPPANPPVGSQMPGFGVFRGGSSWVPSSSGP